MTQPKTQKRACQCIFGSHDTIYTFKNYFVTVFSVINFQFSMNKQYPNRPYVAHLDAKAKTFVEIDRVSIFWTNNNSITMFSTINFQF